MSGTASPPLPRPAAEHHFLHRILYFYRSCTQANDVYLHVVTMQEIGKDVAFVSIDNRHSPQSQIYCATTIDLI